MKYNPRLSMGVLIGMAEIAAEHAKDAPKIEPPPAPLPPRPRAPHIAIPPLRKLRDLGKNDTQLSADAKRARKREKRLRDLERQSKI